MINSEEWNCWTKDMDASHLCLSPSLPQVESIYIPVSTFFWFLSWFLSTQPTEVCFLDFLFFHCGWNQYPFPSDWSAAFFPQGQGFSECLLPISDGPLHEVFPIQPRDLRCCFYSVLVLHHCFVLLLDFFMEAPVWSQAWIILFSLLYSFLKNQFLILIEWFAHDFANGLEESQVVADPLRSSSKRENHELV